MIRRYLNSTFTIEMIIRCTQVYTKLISYLKKNLSFHRTVIHSLDFNLNMALQDYLNSKNIHSCQYPSITFLTRVIQLYNEINI